MTEPSEEKFDRVSSGNAQADDVLGGGFPSQSINVILGHPGTGKTILVEQLVFNNASPGRPILYLTTVAEPLGKVLKYLQRFAFFDPEKLGTQVIYDDVGPKLAERGLEIMIPTLRQYIREYAPKIVVIDSFRALHDLSPNVKETRLLVYELAGLLTAYDTTVFLVGEYSEEESRLYPEFAVADGIIQLLRSPQSSRDERFMRVVKLRGSDYREGLHAFRISDAGLRIYPRLVTPHLPERYTVIPERVTTGVPGLDPLIKGGFWRGSTTLVAGPTGSGKTTIGLQFAVEGARSGEPSLHVSLQENPTQVDRELEFLGANRAELPDLHFLYESPVELHIDSMIVQVFRLLEEKKLRRVVIDSVGELENAASDPTRLHDYLYSLKQHLAVHGATCVLTLESYAGAGPKLTRYGHMADNVVELGLERDRDRLRRTLNVVKARTSAHDTGIHELILGDGGVSVR